MPMTEVKGLSSVLAKKAGRSYESDACVYIGGMAGVITVLGVEMAATRRTGPEVTLAKILNTIDYEA